MRGSRGRYLSSMEDIRLRSCMRENTIEENFQVQVKENNSKSCLAYLDSNTNSEELMIAIKLFKKVWQNVIVGLTFRSAWSTDYSEVHILTIGYCMFEFEPRLKFYFDIRKLLKGRTFTYSGSVDIQGYPERKVYGKSQLGTMWTSILLAAYLIVATLVRELSIPGLGICVLHRKYELQLERFLLSVGVRKMM